MIKIPNNKRFSQVGNSDNEGNIWSSFCLDLTENVGRIRAAARGLIVSKSDDSGLTDMTTPVAFRMFATNSSDQKIWTIAGNMYFNTGLPSDPFTLDATSGTPAVGNGSDMELFNGALYVIGTAKIMKYTGSAWTEIGTNLGTPITSCCVFDQRLYYSKNASQISSITLADVNQNPSGTPNTIARTLQLANNGAGGSNANTITAIRASSNRIWIATVDKTSQNYSAGRGGKIWEWDGSSNEANRYYSLDSIGALSMIIKDDVPWVVDANGVLLRYNGGTFTEVARLPIPPQTYLRNPTNTPTQQFIHPRGMALRDNKILIFINNMVDDATDSIIENLPSGVWEYDPAIGLYHKFGLSQWQNGITTTRTDYTQNRLLEVGALFSAKSSNNSADLNGDLLMGASYYSNATDNLFGVFINDTNQTTPKVAYLVTPKIDSQYVQDIWQKAFVVYKRFLDVTDKIILKYRTREQLPFEGVITWLSTTQFTSTDDLSVYEEGDEVEVTAGTGSGQIEEIVSITLLAGTYTVTLKNAVVGATDTSRARFQKWISLNATTDPTEEWTDFAIGKKSSWIQLKLIMYFTGADEVNTLQLINQEFKPSA